MGARLRCWGEAYLDKAIRRYSPEVAATARAGLKTPAGQVRSIRVNERGAIVDPYIRGLRAQMLKVAGADLKTGRRRGIAAPCQ